MDPDAALARLDQAVADHDVPLALDMGATLAVRDREPEWERYPDAAAWFEDVFLKENW